MTSSSSKNVKESKMETTSRSWLAKPIVGTEFTEDLPLHDVYIGVLKEKKDSSTAIKSISSALPGFTHLKRCSAMKILLTPLKSKELIKETRGSFKEDDILTQEELKSILEKRQFDVSLFEDSFQIMKVPLKPARTKVQAIRASKIWPVNFHPDIFIESLIDGSIFDEDQLESIEKYMLVGIEAAKLEAIGNQACNGSAVIVDPEDGRILAIATSRINEHPLWHASMLAIDLVARLQGGGAWNLQENGNNTKSDETESKSNGDNSEIDISVSKPSNLALNIPVSSSGSDNPKTKELICNINNTKDICDSLSEKIQDKSDGQAASTPTVLPDTNLADNSNDNFKTKSKIIKRKYGQEAPLYYPKSLAKIQLPVERSLKSKTKQKGRRNNGTNSSNQEDTTNTKDKCGPYLCTNYWVFLLKEPCPMCAMSLLHSRVARIFYGVPNKSTGILGSNGILHAVPGLNHRYLVWSGILESECCKTLQEIEHRNIN